MAAHYSGKCDHAMVHRILTDHLAELKEHEQDALIALRPEIHKIVKNVDNIKVTIYLGVFKPIVVTQGDGDNELVIQFNRSGEISYEWTKKTFGQWLYDEITDIASEIADLVITAIKSVIRAGKLALEREPRAAITWKK